ncbi:MAG: DnaA/Hda family protein [Pseudomonadota bacterium]|nr:DnaA/Hda family protein [Pseudomonadota bacterium]
MSRQYPLPLPHKEAMDADDFLVTGSNSEAVACIQQWPLWPSHCIVIHGPSGSGKTHLARVWQRLSGAENFAVGEIGAGALSRPTASGAKVTIEDADQAAGVPTDEEALFHLFNRLRENKGFLLLTSASAPAQWGMGLPDLRSRLLSVPAIPLAAPDDQLLSAMLIKQFRDRQISLGKDVITYLLSHVERTPAAIRDLVGALDRVSLAEGRRITIAMARKLIEDQDFLIP